MSLLNSIKWIAYAELFKIFVQIANILVLTQYVEPDEYGLMAIALVVVNFGVLLKDQGISKALIQKEKLNDELINAAFWFGMYLSFFIMIVTFVASFKIAQFYDDDRLILILSIIALIFPLNSLSAVHIALLERVSKFKLLSLIETLAVLVSFSVALAFAITGWGVYSLVFQSLSYSCLLTTLILFKSDVSIKINSAFRLQPIKSLFNFSSYLFIFNFLNYSSRNADNILIGKYMSVTSLGSYSLAYRIMQFPLASVSFVISRALLPVLSKQQKDVITIKNTYLDCMFMVLIVVAPCMFFLSIFSVEVITNFIGQEWAQSGEILSILAFCAIIQCVLSLSGPVFMSKGNTNHLMKLGFAGATIHTSGFLIGINYNIITFTKIYLLTNIVNATIVLLFTSKLLGIRSPTAFLPCFKLVCINVFICVGGQTLKEWFTSVGGQFNITNLIVTVSLYLLTYFIVLYISDRDFRRIASKIIKKLPTSK